MKCNYNFLLFQYEQRQEFIEEYKKHKEELRKAALLLQRQTRAATKIQAWWRGTMFRRHLGPYKRKKKKGKGKKGSARGSSKSSGKKRK